MHNNIHIYINTHYNTCSHITDTILTTTHTQHSPYNITTHYEPYTQYYHYTHDQLVPHIKHILTIYPYYTYNTLLHMYT